MVLVQMDEKWFYVIVVQKNNKGIPVLGVEPLRHAMHHKSHIPKCMCIDSTALVPHNNNIAKGGVAEKLVLCSVGDLFQQKKAVTSTFISATEPTIIPKYLTINSK